MSAYVAIPGDTFEKIARKVYGTETKSGLISKANPGVLEPLTTGITVFIPVDPAAVKISPAGAPSENADEVAVNIDGDRFRFWDSVQITRSLDTFSTVELGAPFEVNNEGFKGAFEPLTFKPLAVTIGGAPLFTGTMVSVVPALGVDKRTVTAGGYSLPGVLNDCPIPASAFPLEYSGQNLQDIAKSVAAAFGLAVEFEGEPGPVFGKVASDPTKKAFNFLSGLARQRNFIISSTAEGALLFRKSTSLGNPVARLVQGSAPLESVTPQFNPQDYYSHITGLQPALLGVGGAQFTVENPLLKGVIRPFTFKADDTAKGNIKEAVEAKAGRMFANAVSYNVGVATWRDPQGDVWADNTTVTLVAPGAMVYSEYEFIIRNVTLNESGDRRSATLNLVLPGVFSGEIPESLPWAE